MDKNQLEIMKSGIGLRKGMTKAEAFKMCEMCERKRKL